MISPTALQQNKLLGSLDNAGRAAISPHLTRLELAGGTRLGLARTDERGVCFPETMVTSIVDELDDGTPFTIGLVGSEGLVGWSGMLGAPALSHRGAVLLQGGSGLFISPDALAAISEEHHSVQTAVLRFVQSFTVQMSRTIICSLRDGIDRRLARWLLMLHDRIRGDDLAITHAELSEALHVRRASVTDCLHVLEGERVVKCARGRIAISDRARLRALAGETYGAAEASYRTLLGPFGKD